MTRSRRHAAVLLLLATLLAYSPYATNRLVSGNPDGDGATYLIVLADACAQARAGVFPIYAGQSALRFNGGLYPQAQAPVLTLVGPLLDALTGRRLHATTLMNLIVLLAALLGALAMYAVLLGLAPAPWPAAALAFAYVACPGVLGVLFRLDMLTSFLTLPLLPWIWQALLRAWQGDEARAGVTLGLTLALLGATHPPVALWTASAAAVVGLAGLVLWRRGVKAAAIGAAVFAAAFAWPLATLLALTGGNAANVGLATAGGRLSPETVARTLASVRGDFPGALLPVGWVRGNPVAGWPMETPAAALVPPSWSEGAVLPYLQLGWMLWAALALGGGLAAVALARRATPDRRLLALLLGALCVAVLLLPLPLLTAQLWALLPGVFNVTKWWPMQRLYLVLASLAAPIGMLAWSAWPARRRCALTAALWLLMAWSAHEAAKFTALGFDSRARGPEAARLENVRLHAKDLQSGAPRALPEFTDPLLHFRVADAAGRVRLDNQAAARAACARARPLETRPGDATLGRVTLEPRRRALLCVQAPRPGLLEAHAPGFYRHLAVGAARDSDLLPLFTTLDAPLTVSVRLTDASGRRARIDGGTVGVTSYNPQDLPVRVASWIPLRAEVAFDGADGAPLWIETPRQYVAGYRARVDGHDAPVERSANGLVAVALTPGRHVIELACAGPAAARATFPLSAATWLLGAAWLAWPRRREPGIG